MGWGPTQGDRLKTIPSGGRTRITIVLLRAIRSARVSARSHGRSRFRWLFIFRSLFTPKKPLVYWHMPIASILGWAKKLFLFSSFTRIPRVVCHVEYVSATQVRG